MKQENGDNNIAEEATIPKFSELDGILTPFQLLELSFDDVLVYMIVTCTKLCRHKEKTDIFLKLLMKKFGYS